MQHHGWISRSLLTHVEQSPLRHLFGSHAYFQTDGARLLDAWAFALWASLLVVIALVVWRLRTHVVTPRNEARLWVALILIVVVGSAAWYSLVSEPDTDVNFWGLAPFVAKLPAPVYTDRYSGFVLEYLSAYHAPNIRSGSYLPDNRVRPLLRRHRGCFLLSEPQLSREKASNLAGSPMTLVFSALHHPPGGWHIIKRVTATENPLASIVILCAHASSH